MTETLIEPRPADSTPVNDPIGVAQLDGGPDDLFPCPTCDGQSEVLISGDPRGPNFVTRTCWDCRGEGEVTLAWLKVIERQRDDDCEGP